MKRYFWVCLIFVSAFGIAGATPVIRIQSFRNLQKIINLQNDKNMKPNKNTKETPLNVQSKNTFNNEDLLKSSFGFKLKFNKIAKLNTQSKTVAQNSPSREADQINLLKGKIRLLGIKTFKRN